MKQLQALGLLVFLLVSFHISYAHPGHPKKKPQPDSTRHNSVMNPAYPAGDRVTDTTTSKQVQSIAPMPAPLADYPTYHPMVVHVPIMLLILAGLLQLIALVKPSRPVHGLTLLLAAGGTVGAYVASTLVHPHTSGRPRNWFWKPMRYMPTIPSGWGDSERYSKQSRSGNR